MERQERDAGLLMEEMWAKGEEQAATQARQASLLRLLEIAGQLHVRLVGHMPVCLAVRDSRPALRVVAGGRMPLHFAVVCACLCLLGRARVYACCVAFVWTACLCPQQHMHVVGQKNAHNRA